MGFLIMGMESGNQTKSSESLSGLTPLCRGSLSLQPRWVVVSNYSHLKRLWVLGTLEKNQPQPKLDSQVESSYVATSLTELFALAFSILHLCCKSSLARARIFLRIRWCQCKCSLRLWVRGLLLHI